MSTPEQYDHYLSDNGPAALVIREHLMPVEGKDGVFFPPTYAVGDNNNFPGGYNIDPDANGVSVCLIDSAGSQANRIEPMFAEAPYSELVPQITIETAKHQVNLLDIAHRAGDAMMRCSELQATLHDAFAAALGGDDTPLARIAPTSLVFGVWDSRDTQTKMPRLISSTIRAYGVRTLTRSAQYIPSIDYVAEGYLDEPTTNATREAYASRGFGHRPATGQLGGVMLRDGADLRRDATLSLTALRRLRAGGDAEQTLILQRYILGLSLLAFTRPATGDLRQGCLLVLDPSKPREFVKVLATGERKPATIIHAQTLDYAKQTAAAFGVGESKTVKLVGDLAKQDAIGNATAANGAASPTASPTASPAAKANAKKSKTGSKPATTRRSTNV